MPDADALAVLEDAVWQAPADADARTALGHGLLAAGRTGEAAAVFAALLRRAPRHPGALAGGAAAARHRGDRDTAIVLTRRAVAAAPHELGLTLELAHDLLASGQTAAAEALFRSALPDPRARLGLGHVARARADRGAALAAFRAVLADHPDNTDAALEVAAELAARGDAEAAAPLVEGALAREPMRLQALLQRARLSRRREDFHAAVAAHPASVPALVAAAEAELAAGAPAEAEALLRRALAVAPDDLGALMSLSELAFLAEDPETCLALADRAAAAHPRDAVPLLQATRALMELGRTDAALARLVPRGSTLGWPPELRARWGELLRRDGRWEAARAALADGAPDHFLLWLQRVLLHLGLHELDAAAALLADAPAEGAFQRAYAEHLRGQLAEARWELPAAAAHYRAAAALDPPLAWPHAELARVCLLLGDLDGCAAHQQRSLELDAGVHRLRGRRVRLTASHVGQIWDEMRADPELVAMAAAAAAGPPTDAVPALCAVLREAPDTLAPSLMLLVALRRAGAFGRPAPEASPIPRRIVQFWDTPDPPTDVAALMATWPAQHPGWDYVRFDLRGAGDWLATHLPPPVVQAFARAPVRAQKADIFRLAVLWVVGGVWADADDRCLAPLEPLVAPGVTLAGWQELFGSLGNNLLAASPGHRALGRALSLAVNAVNRGDEDIPWLSTGPGCLSRALAQEIAEDATGTVLSGLTLLERGEAARLATFHCFAAYKRTKRHWMQAAFGEGAR